MSDLIQCIGHIRTIAANGDAQHVDQAAQLISDYLSQFLQPRDRLTAIRQIESKLEPYLGYHHCNPQVKAFYVTLSEYLDQIHMTIQINLH
ncbi:hypothetical protein G3T14_22115 [Methylobacterium sp. BTF04]|uniref:hypothetical protein n=1 Tax=Methylobacterium sp. BTF04 TaxID=2708300 RepID=UPI0013D39AD7|nr:hypothetical protein [Methylobacterium sp. BTF04]NEU14774.1 hypothetical protein [Methylobacterium sp. BTF04]